MAAVAASANELFVCGGYGGRRDDFLSSCERWVEGRRVVCGIVVVRLSLFFIYFACSPSWRPLLPLERARQGAAAIVWGRRLSASRTEPHLLLTGGTNGDKLSDVSVLSLGRNKDAPQWIELAPMHHARCNHAIALLTGRILVVAGFQCDTVEMLTPPRAVGDPGQWTDLNPIGLAFSECVRLAVYRNRLLAFGKP